MSANDERIKAILHRAATDAEYYRLLIENRRAALEPYNLTDAERDMFLAVPNEQLEKMIQAAHEFKEYRLPSGTIIKVLGGVALGAACVASVFGYTFITTTEGISPIRSSVDEARAVLEVISREENEFKAKHGKYATDAEFQSTDSKFWQDIQKVRNYSFSLSATPGSFQATATPKTDISNLPILSIGPDGKIQSTKKQ